VFSSNRKWFFLDSSFDFYSDTVVIEGIFTSKRVPRECSIMKKKKTILLQSQLFKSFLFIDGILDCVFLI
jgi:hypothetical protein